MTLQELNEQMIKCQQYVEALGMMNTYGKNAEQRVAQDAQYQLAKDAWMRAEQDYRKALAETPTQELIELAKETTEPKEIIQDAYTPFRRSVGWYPKA